MNNIINNDQHYYNSASNIESSTIKSELIIDEGIKQEYNEGMKYIMKIELY